MVPEIIGAVVTALIGALIGWLEKKKQDELNIQNAVSIATSQAMLASSTQAQTVQANMNAVPATPITDMASAQAAFGLAPTSAATLPQRSIISSPYRTREMECFSKGIRAPGAPGSGPGSLPFDPAMKINYTLKRVAHILVVIVCLFALSGCGSNPTAGVIPQYPTINNPAPPEAMFANPEIPLSEREKAGMTWSSALYKRVEVYNNFAEQSNAQHGYYSTVATTARRMFE